MFPDSFSYLSAGGYVIHIAGDGPLSDLKIRVVSERELVFAELSAANPDDYVLADAVWTPSPAQKGYSSQSLIGQKAVWKASAPVGSATVTVPTRTGGKREVEVEVLISEGYIPSTMEWAVIRGAQTIPVEAFFGFTTARTLTARLYRTASGTIGSSTKEETLITERQVDFPAGSPVKVTHQMSFGAPGAIKGRGWEFEWRVYLDGVGGDRTMITEPLPVWQIGDDPSVAAPDPHNVPSVPRPDIYRRDATTFGKVQPVPGWTYEQMQAATVECWKASEKNPDGSNVWSNLGGAWLNIKAYGMSVFPVDLDDATIPRRTVTHYDMWQRGWGEGKGWYGTDPNAHPWPQVKVAENVPIPDYAQPSFGTDRAMTIVGLRNGQVEAIWEFWLMRRRANGDWWAASAGRAANPIWQHSFGYTTSASGIAMLAGGLLMSEAVRAISYCDAERAAGRVPDKREAVRLAGDHCLAFAVNNPSGRAMSWPAIQNDGTHSNPGYPVEGQWVYLDPALNLEAQNYGKLQWLMAAIMQVRGAYCTDRTNSNTGLALEVDTAYSKKWTDTVLKPGDSLFFGVPDWALIPGKIYQTEAEFRADMPASPPAPEPEPTPDPAPAPKATLSFTDATSISFTGAGQTSNYHVWANSLSEGAGLLVWLHGDAAFEHKNPTSTYVFGGASGVVQNARSRGYITVSALTPDATGTQTWWENGSTRADYVKALLDHLRTGYAVPNGKIILAGFSGGAQQTTQFFLDKYPNYFETGGGTIVFGGGEAPDGTPVFSAATKANMWMHWAVGENDTAANASDGFDGRGAAVYGEQWFRGQGFTRTSIEIVPGQGHELDNFGSILAQQLTKLGS